MNAYPKATILVVDDISENLQLLVRLLKAQDYKVHAAPNGPRAIAIARNTLPDLILLDIRMPEMDGFEVCEQLKADRLTRDIPVIFISALNDVVDKVQGFEAGGVDYIIKPFSFEELIARVNSALRFKQLSDNLRRQSQELENANKQIYDLNQDLLENAAPDAGGMPPSTNAQSLKSTPLIEY